MIHLLRRLRRPLVLTAGTARRKLVDAGVLLVVVMLLHILAMMGFESLSFVDAFWLTFTTITTVGYGDLSAATPEGRLVTVVLMYSLGIFLLANLAGYWVDYRAERRDRMLRGRWSWNMKDHILVLNVPSAHPEGFLRRLVEEIKHWRGLADIPIQVVTEAFPEGLPEPLRELGVVHQHGDPDDPEVLAHAHAADAAHILLLTTSETDPRADSITLSVMERLRAQGTRAHLVAECVEQRNRDRLLQFHPQATLIRPVRAYPEMLVRALDAPGTEQILENLFRREGVFPERYDVPVKDLAWPDIVWRVVRAGCGTPIAYLDDHGRVVSCPPGEAPITARALFVIVDGHAIPSPEALRAALGPARD
jgi:voltage-gated potassium channel